MKWQIEAAAAADERVCARRPKTRYVLEDEVINLSRERLGTRPMQTPSSRDRTHGSRLITRAGNACSSSNAG